MTGYIKLHRSLLEWQYWDDHNTTRLLIFFLISANYEEKKWMGITINQGSFVTSFEKISQKTGLTVQQVRRSTKILEECGEITRKTTSKWQAITLVKWEQLQIEEEKRTSKRTNKEQAKNKQRTTTKESILFNNNILEEIEEEKHTLVVWLEKYASRVQQMQNPITNAQAARIEKEFNAKDTATIFEAMHNNKELFKRYVDANVTFRSWVNMRRRDNPNFGCKESEVKKFKAPWD